MSARAHRPVVLTERQRRRVWFGFSRAGYLAGDPAVVERARVGRDWLARIGQLPRFSPPLRWRGPDR